MDPVARRVMERYAANKEMKVDWVEVTREADLLLREANFAKDSAQREHLYGIGRGLTNVTMRLAAIAQELGVPDGKLREVAEAFAKLR